MHVIALQVGLAAEQDYMDVFTARLNALARPHPTVSDLSQYFSSALDTMQAYFPDATSSHEAIVRQWADAAAALTSRETHDAVRVAQVCCL